jgi:hypothetical protein
VLQTPNAPLTNAPYTEATMAAREVIFFYRTEQLTPHLPVAALPLSEPDANFLLFSSCKFPSLDSRDQQRQAFSKSALSTFAVFPLLDHANGGDL